MAVEIGIGDASPSKRRTVRRQMRTRRERTSGAWMRGCETIPMAARKKPHCRRQVQLPQRILREHGQNSFSSNPWRTCSMPDPRSLESINRVLAKVK